jgi:hypothetical protein
MIETLIAIIVGLLIALWRIANFKTEDPSGEAERAFRRGAEQLDKYYKSKGE